MGEKNGIQILSGLTASNGRPVIVYRWGGQRGQFTPAEARSHALDLLAAAEMAVLNASLWATTNAMGLDARTSTAFVQRVRCNARRERHAASSNGPAPPAAA